MKTTLPTLAYSPTGFEWSNDMHSSTYSMRRAYPRSDLEHFNKWDGFEEQIHKAITSHMDHMNIPTGAEYDIGSMPKIRKLVCNEEDLRSQAEVQVHDLVQEVLKTLGVVGRFSRPGSGNDQIIGAPDFSWLYESTLHPKLVVEYKTKWAAPLDDLPGYLHCNNANNVLQRQSVEALHQLYGYMTFNENKYGVLSNMYHAWFFQCVETLDEGGKTLQYYGPVVFEDHPPDSPSMLKAFVGIILLAETNSAWFHSSPTSAEVPPGRYFGPTATGTQDRNAAVRRVHRFHPTVVNEMYQVMQLDPRLCHFHRSSVRPAPQGGCTVRATLLRSNSGGSNPGVFCKIVDLCQNSNSMHNLDVEAHNYAMLHHLQGKIIPQVYGYYEIWGLLRLLVLEDVGDPIPLNKPINARNKKKMRTALEYIHSTGHVHGDVARRNFCMKGTSVFLVDLEMMRHGSPAESKAEIMQIDAM